MKIVSRFRILLAEKETREHRTISLQKVADEAKVSIYTIKKLNADDLREFPMDAMEALCVYFNCKPGDLFVQQSRDGTKDVKLTDIQTPMLALR
jgi:DNA-binding Xre family transcriptional regulator